MVFDYEHDDSDTKNCPECSIMLKDQANKNSPYSYFNSLIRKQVRKKRLCKGVCNKMFMSSSSGNRYCIECYRNVERAGQLMFN